VRVLYRFERRTITFLSRLGIFEDTLTCLVDSVNSKQKRYMARLGRFELPTSGSGDQRSIHLSYRRAVRNFAFRKFQTRQLHKWGRVSHLYNSILDSTLDASDWLLSFSPRMHVYPLACSLICFASFSTSSAFFTTDIDNTSLASVFSTSAFNCDARSYSFSMSFFMSF
jgi:hypothetical protein